MIAHINTDDGKLLLEQIKKVDYLFYLAKWIGRISEFVKDWDFGVGMIMLCVSILGGIFSFIGYGFEHNNVSITTCVWFGVKMGIKYGLSGGILLYLTWEFRNLCQTIVKWSNHYLYERQATHRNR